ncbi:MAG: hypothetical protein V7724_10275 [Sediminicola sp.]|tara:strand:+ start:12530 stop:13111 length:582 start_codon:yes stop_codon:yes gene_type:complete
MAQDLRKLYRETDRSEPSLKEGHEQRFKERLEREFPGRKKRSASLIWKMAACLLVLVSTGIFLMDRNRDGEIQGTVDRDPIPAFEGNITLGDLSPDLKKLENYYTTSINLALSQLEISDVNKAMVDSYIAHLAELDTEYKELNAELNTLGPNDQTITAMIKNLQLRLQLLHKLKEKVNELKKINDEHIRKNTI